MKQLAESLEHLVLKFLNLYINASLENPTTPRKKKKNTETRCTFWQEAASGTSEQTPNIPQKLKWSGNFSSLFAEKLHFYTVYLSENERTSALHFFFPPPHVHFFCKHGHMAAGATADRSAAVGL